MAELSLPDILNDCIDRLAAGQNVADCLSAYPGQAARLRPLLDSGLAAVRVTYPIVEVTGAQERIWSRMEQAFNVPLPSQPLRLPRPWRWAILAAAALLMLAGVMLAAQNSQPGDPLYGVKVFIESLLPSGEAAPSVTPIPTLTETAMPSATNTQTATETLTVTETLTASETPVPTLTPTVAGGITGAIEGPVEAINGSVITIYGIEIEIAGDDPLLTVIEVGDVLRVEGDFGEDGVTIDVADVTVVGAEEEIFTSDTGEVWRDDGTCNNPPPDWAPANGWRRRCEGGNSVVAPGSRGQGNESGKDASGSGSGSGMGRGNS